MQTRIIRQYYTLSFMFSVGGMSIISAIYATFLLKHGLSLLEVNIVNAIFYVTLFTFEIPTGAFADIFGRKASFVAACVLMGLGMFVYGSSETIVGFIVAEMISALAHTFRSGAFQAWLVDNLKHYGYEGEFNRIFGRESLINKIGGGFGAVLGSYLLQYNPAFPFYYGGSMVLLCAVISLFVMKEEYFVRGHLSFKNGFVSMRNIMTSSIRYGVNDKAVRFILVLTGIQIFAVQALNMYWQPFFSAKGLVEVHLGYLYNGMMIFLALGAGLASRFLIVGKEKFVIVLLHASIGLLVVITTMFTNTNMIILLFLLHEVPRGCLGPYMDNYIHKRIPSNERATIISFSSIAHHVGGTIGLLVSGLIAQSFGISSAWIVSGLFLLIGSLIMVRR
jgi:MFS family permease